MRVLACACLLWLRLREGVRDFIFLARCPPPFSPPLVGSLSHVVPSPLPAYIAAQYLNLAIDFGAVLAFVFLFKWDLDRGSELQDMVDTKLESKKKDKVLSVAMKEREITLSNLKISVRVSEEGETREASLGGVQEGAKQHVILVAGGRSAIRDALLGANLMSMDFAMRDVLIVPYEIGLDDATRRTRPSGGFGDAPKWETANYVARCVGDGWKEYIDSEMKDAIAQNGEKVTEDGIAVVVKNDGTIIRRGVGKVRAQPPASFDTCALYTPPCKSQTHSLMMITYLLYKRFPPSLRYLTPPPYPPTPEKRSPGEIWWTS